VDKESNTEYGQCRFHNNREGNRRQYRINRVQHEARTPLLENDVYKFPGNNNDLNNLAAVER
jgi:hypothetical protein